MSVQAQCSCGQLQLSCSSEPLRVSVCHCEDCQRRSGSAFASQVRLHQADVVIRGEARCYQRQAESGAQLAFGFCPQCGATVYFSNSALAGAMMVPLGAITNRALAPSISVYEARQQPWLHLTGIEQHYD
ncbi:GFA family protein [uncultured Ferrimonas sp.]|uniref:GFA family protein n=1 Tax=uncultured Ferrimonas sp. TaxID=432640 RepID=UPI002620B318|nr:GFA family protein [uncultured Ferrimonas sp.]